MFYITPVCTVCFKYHERLCSVNNKDLDNVQFIQKLKYCTFGIDSLERDIPLFICSNCCWSLNAAYKFKKNCVRNIERLKNFVAQLKRTSVNTTLPIPSNNTVLDINLGSDFTNLYFNRIGNITIQPVNNTPTSKPKNSSLYSNIKINIPKHPLHWYSNKSIEIDSDSTSNASFNSLEDSCEIPSYENTPTQSATNVTEVPSLLLSDVVVVKQEIVLSPDELDSIAVRYDELDSDSINLLCLTNDSNSSKTNNRTSSSNKTSKPSEVSNMKHEEIEDEVGSYESAETLQDKPYKKPEAKRFVCTYCNKLFVKNYSLQRHLLIHANKYEYPCNYCNLKYRMFISLRSHLSSAHGIETEAHKCPVCKKLFAEENELVVHIKSAHPRFQCPHCENNFSSEIMLKRHMLSHISNSPINCHLCGKLFKTGFFLKTHLRNQHFYCFMCKKEFGCERELLSHTAKSHPKNIILKCTKCGTNFTNRKCFRAHLRMHKRLSFKCSYCSESFGFRSHLKKHISKIHKQKTNSKSIFSCRFCNKTFEDKSDFEEHKALHALRKCQLCDRKFTRLTHYKLHIKKHNIDQLYVCDKCGNDFIDLELYKDHIRSHDEDNNFKCEYCGKVYYFLVSLKCHLKKSHKDKIHECVSCEMVLTKDEFLEHTCEKEKVANLKNKRTENLRKMPRLNAHKPKQCLYCTKKFNFYENFMNHVKSYHKSKLFECGTCNCSYIQKKSLDNHTRKMKHTPKFTNGKVTGTYFGRTVYKCIYCPKTYLCRDNLNTHLKTQHESKLFSCDTCEKFYLNKADLDIHIYEKDHIPKKQEHSDQEQDEISDNEQFELSDNEQYELSDNEQDFNEDSHQRQEIKCEQVVSSEASLTEMENVLGFSSTNTINMTFKREIDAEIKNITDLIKAMEDSTYN